jgi:cytochrome P450
MPDTVVTINVGRPPAVLFGLNHLIRIRRDQLAFYEELRAKYGDVVRLRLGPHRSWILFHPEQIEALLTRQWASFIRFKRLTEVVAQWNGDSLLLAEGDEWRERRRKVLPAFQSRRMPGYGDKAVAHAARLGAELARRARAIGSVTIDTDAVMARLTLDIAAGTLFGAEPPDNGDEIENALQVLSDVAFRESTSPFTLPDWLPLESKRRKTEAMEVMDRLVTGLVKQGLARGADDCGDLLSMLIEQHAGDARAIRNDAMSLLIAGHETSGALLGWAFLCLAQNPEWLVTVKAEIDRELLGRPVCMKDLLCLPVVRAVVEETLRLYPPAYSLFPRQALEALDLAGVPIAKGDLVQIAPFTLHRDPRWFPEPDRFDPGRFLQEPSWPRYAYLPFGAGPRVCIGQNFAMMEACLVIATLLQGVEPIAIVGEVPTHAAKFSLRPRGGLHITWRAR